MEQNENYQGKINLDEDTHPNATVSTIKPIFLKLGSNPGYHCEKRDINSLSYCIDTSGLAESVSCK
jgi:hypothetical protein